MHQNNSNENKKIPHQYKVGDKVLYLIQTQSKYSKNLYKGPYEITKIKNNGIVQLCMGATYEMVNIKLFRPYFQTN